MLGAVGSAVKHADSVAQAAFVRNMHRSVPMALPQSSKSATVALAQSPRLPRHSA